MLAGFEPLYLRHAGDGGGCGRRITHLDPLVRWVDNWRPADLHAVVRRFFVPGPTAEIGCGSGRDAAWLDADGFPTYGFDVSEGLLAEARRRHPPIRFSHAMLPDLTGIEVVRFANVLCETIIMHLDPAEITPALERFQQAQARRGPRSWPRLCVVEPHHRRRTQVVECGVEVGAEE